MRKCRQSTRKTNQPSKYIEYQGTNLLDFSLYKLYQVVKETKTHYVVLSNTCVERAVKKEEALFRGLA